MSGKENGYYWIPHDSIKGMFPKLEVGKQSVPGLRIDKCDTMDWPTRINFILNASNVSSFEVTIKDDRKGIIYFSANRKEYDSENTLVSVITNLNPETKIYGNVVVCIK